MLDTIYFLLFSEQSIFFGTLSAKGYAMSEKVVNNTSLHCLVSCYFPIRALNATGRITKTKFLLDYH